MQLPQLKIIDALAAALSGGEGRRAEVVGPWGSAKALVAAQVAEALGRSLLFITSGRIESESAHDDLVTFAGQESCALFPAWEVLPGDKMNPCDDIVAERMHTLENLATAGGRPWRVAAPIRSVMQHVIDRDKLNRDVVTLAVDDDHDLEDLIARLVRMGYRRDLMVEQRGEMSVRGGIFDVFPISGELPYRVEFFGDTIESIRRFEPETQRSVEQVTSFRILPYSEKALLAAASSEDDVRPLLLDYFPKDTVVVLDEPVAVAEEAVRLTEQFGESPFFATWDKVLSRAAEFPRLSAAQIGHDPEPETPRLTAAMRSMTGWAGDQEGFWDQLTRWEADGYTVALLCNNPGERQRLYELLEERGHRPGQGPFDLRVDIGRLHAGFVSPEDRLAVLSEREIFGRHYVRRVRRRFEAGSAITTFSELKPGDYVVHMAHGIGRYLGLRRFSGKAGDFLGIQYAAGDKIYVPVTHIDTVQKYSGGDSSRPKVDKLGGATWARTKARVKKAVRDMTEELLRLYAARQSQQGHAFSGDTPWQREFEDAFEYDETPDQARAIIEAKRDMESPRPMDRLICGDVGFGKTEVALRAAFKAVMDNRQVAVLVPTTVLAQQHFATFSERLADYPVTVEVLSRFRSAAQQKQTVERLKSGEVDIIVGTHRLTSKDIHFKDLGLVIIDEEQHFGVAQKERLKKLRTLVDVITMTATPIPRTLHLSLMGARDMSIINTAPNDRLPIHTCIEVFDATLIREAIERELARDGQVFFVHNRVQSIASVANVVRELTPHGRVAIAHGQMPERDLAEVMSAFIRREIDVLVCTTIIGSGLDIPNANTIIINRADRFGLAELYQLRGRVGRYKHRAFAYLLVPGDRALSADAQKRLKALEDFSTLGAGFSVAMRDLEIRGSGNILGAEQHGYIAAVGYDTYTDLVAEAVAELKGEPARRRTLPPVDIAADTHIPEEYVASEAQKITLYKRLASVQSVAEVEELAEELRDRFGKPPGPVRRLIDVVHVRALGGDIGASRVAVTRDKIVITFESAQLFTRKTRNTLAHAYGEALSFAWQERPGLTLKLEPARPEEQLEPAKRLLKALADL